MMMMMEEIVLADMDVFCLSVLSDQSWHLKVTLQELQCSTSLQTLLRTL